VSAGLREVARDRVTIFIVLRDINVRRTGNLLEKDSSNGVDAGAPSGKSTTVKPALPATDMSTSLLFGGSSTKHYFEQPVLAQSEIWQV